MKRVLPVILILVLASLACRAQLSGLPNLLHPTPQPLTPAAPPVLQMPRTRPKSGDLKKFERLYRQQLATTEAGAALTRVLEMASAAPICLMCYEREPSECHRQFTIEPLEARRGEMALHLFAAPPTKQGSLL